MSVEETLVVILTIGTTYSVHMFEIYCKLNYYYYY